MIHTTTSLVCLLLITQSRLPEAAESATGAALARAFPAEGLVLYVEYDGLDAHPKGWSGTAVYGMLNRTKAGAMMAEVGAQIADAFPHRPRNLPKGAEVVDTLEQVVKRGFAHGLYESDARITVVRGGGTAPNRPPLERLLTALFLSPSQTVPPPSLIRGRSVVMVKSGGSAPPEDVVRTGLPLPPAGGAALALALWSEGNDLIAAFGVQPRQVEMVLDAIEGKRPSVATHPARRRALAERAIDGFEPTGLFFATPIKEFTPADGKAFGRNEPALPPVPTKQLPRTQPTYISARWGFHGPALLTDVRIDVPRPRQGLAALLDQGPFRTDRLPPVAAGTRSLGAFALELASAHDPILELVRSFSFNTYRAIVEGEESIRQSTGLRVREDLLTHLGTTWLVSISAQDRRGRGARPPSAPVLVGELKDAAAFRRALDTLAAWFNRSMREAEAAGGPAREPILQLEPLPAGEAGYVLTAPSGLSGPFDHGLAPTILMNQGRIAIALAPGQARTALAASKQAPGRWVPEGEVKAAIESTPPNLALLVVGDTRESPVPEVIARLPSASQILINWIIDSVEESAASSFYAAFGLPRPGGMRIHFEEDRLPDPKEIRRYLFPSVMAVTTDDRGVRLILREAFPMASWSEGLSLKYKAELGKPPKMSFSFGWDTRSREPDDRADDDSPGRH